MLQLFRTVLFFFGGRPYGALATLSRQGGRGRVLIGLADAELDAPFDRGSLGIDLDRGLDVPMGCPPRVQALLLTLLAAFRSVPGFPAVRLNFLPPVLPYIHPIFRNGRLRLLLYADDRLLDSLLLNVPCLTDSEEDTCYIRSAMRTLIDRWEDQLRSRSLRFEFRLQRLS